MVACKPTVPSKYIQPDDMEDLLYDYHIAQAMANESGFDERDKTYKQTLYFAAVLEKHGVTKAEFDSSLVYYYTRADRFNDIYKNVAARLSEDAMELGASEGEVNRFANLTASGDTVNIWEGDLSTLLLPYAPYNRYSFHQKADTSFRKGDSFMLLLETEYIYQTGTRNAQACIAVRYDNDTVISRVTAISNSGTNQLRMPSNGDHAVREISGYIYLATEKEPTTTLKLLFLRNIQLFKFRKQQAVKRDSAATIIQPPKL